MLTTPSTELWLPFEGNANDSSGKGRNGTLIGSPTLVAGRFGRAYSFALGQRVDVGPVIELGTGDFSFSGWMYQTKTNTVAVFASNAQEFANTRALMYRDNNAQNHVLSALVQHDTTTVIIRDTVAMAENTWVHAVLTRSGASLRLYKNAVLVASSDVGPTGSVGSTAGGSNHWVFGDRAAPASSGLSGRLDDVRIYSRVLLPDEIMVLYAGAGSIRG